jgi:hypothetical protein
MQGVAQTEPRDGVNDVNEVIDASCEEDATWSQNMNCAKRKVLSSVREAGRSELTFMLRATEMTKPVQATKSLEGKGEF